MNMIEDGMKKVLAKEEKGGNEKYIAHNKLIMLGPKQYFYVWSPQHLCCCRRLGRWKVCAVVIRAFLYC